MRSRFVLLLILVVAIVAVAYLVLGPPLAQRASVLSAATGVRGALTTTNSARRTGAYFLPSGYRGRPLPVLVGIHGTGGSGDSIVTRFEAMAEREKFLIVAPDSRIAPNGLVTWEVPTEPGERTEDWDHVRRCVDELRSIAGVSVDAARTLIVGFSGGGSTAPYVASVDDFYTAFAVLHGGVFVGGLGPRRVRGWLSTGDADSWRPPSQVRESAERVRRLGFGSIVYRVYHEGHELRAEEVEELVEWWLHP